MKWIETIWQGRTIKVPCEKINGKLWYHINGETFVYEKISSKNNYTGQLNTAVPGALYSPMPGKVIKVNFQVGDTVKVGDTVIVLEAMKMEYSIESDINGVIKELNCQELDQVQLKQNLAVIEGE